MDGKSEIETPDRLKYDCGLYKRSPLVILRQGLDQAIDNDCPSDVIKAIRIQIIAQEKRERGYRMEDDYSI